MPDQYPDERKNPSDGRGKHAIAGDASGLKSSEQPPSRGARRGFAAMDERMQREIASKGGHSQGKENNRGNFWHDRERAREAGRKGGEANGRNRQHPARGSERP